MGTWGTGIFDNDDAGDVREEFRDLIAAGKSADEATAGLVESYGAADVDLEDHDFWLALAATQHSLGHVGTGVIERAVAIIDDPEELERWDPSDARRRRAALKKLRSRLQKKPRSPKRLRARRGVDTALEEGQHLLFDTGTRVLLLRVLGVSTDKGGRYPFVMLLDWDATEASLEQAHRLPGRLDPGKNRREGERMGIKLIGEPDDPPSLRILANVSDEDTPTSRRTIDDTRPHANWVSGWVPRWSQVDEFLQERGVQQRPWGKQRP